MPHARAGRHDIGRRFGLAPLALAIALLAPFVAVSTGAVAQTAPPGASAAPVAPGATALPSIVPLAGLKVSSYMGTWYQVAWFPNRFQKQCVSDTVATYRLLPNGEVEVINRCRQADGSIDRAEGLARPADSVLRGDQLEPAQLEVSFLPKLLRWLPIWGPYWVLRLADDGRYAVVSEPKRQYLWVLSRTPTLAAADETAIRSALTEWGYDLNRWERHPHGAVAAVAPR